MDWKHRSNVIAFQAFREGERERRMAIGRHENLQVCGDVTEKRRREEEKNDGCGMLRGMRSEVGKR